MKERQFYIMVGDQQMGPLSERELCNLRYTDEVTPETYCWEAGTSHWVRFKELNSFAVKKYVSRPTTRTSFEGRFWEGLVGLLVFFGFIAWNNRPTKTSPSTPIKPSVAESHKPSTHIFESQDDLAEKCAKTLVLDNLKSPSTATFVEARILYKEPPWYQIYTVVDSQNGFGAYIRSKFVCTIKLIENRQFTYKLVAGIQEMDDRLVQAKGVLEGLRAASDWPGTNNDTE